MIALKREIGEINAKSGEKDKKEWVEFFVTSEDGSSLEGFDYEMILSSGKKRRGTVAEGNVIREDNIIGDVKVNILHKKIRKD